MSDCAGKRCSVEGCERPHEARGLCDTHRRRQARRGTAGGTALQRTTRTLRDWPEVGARVHPGLVAFLDGHAAQRRVARSDVVGDALEEWAKARGYVPPPVQDVVAEAVEELREARRKVEASTRAFWASAGREVQT